MSNAGARGAGTGRGWVAEGGATSWVGAGIGMVRDRTGVMKGRRAVMKAVVFILMVGLGGSC